MLKRLLAALAIVSLTGCINQRTVLVVNPDGSGNIVMSQVFGKEAVQMMESMTAGLSGLGGDSTAAKKDPFFDEDEFKKAASKFGEGVEYVKAQKLDKDGAKGAAIVYKFADVTKLRFAPGGNMGGGMGGMGQESDEPEKPEDMIAFAFGPGADGTKKLTIKMPKSMSDEEKDKVAADAAEATKNLDAAGPEAAAAKAMASQMFKGMRIAVEVEVKGEIVNTTSKHRSTEKPSRVTLMDIDFDKILSSPEGAKVLGGGDNEDLMKDLMKAGKLPGIVAEMSPEVVVEFK